MDIILAKDKTKIISNVDDYEIIQIDELEKTIEKYDDEEKKEMNIFFLTNFEHVEVNKKISGDFIAGFYNNSVCLPVFKFNLFDFVCLQEVLSLEEIEELALFSTKTANLSEDILTVSFTEKLTFLSTLFKFLKKEGFFEWENHKTINGYFYSGILSTADFIKNEKLLKLFLEKVYSFIKDNTDFDEVFSKEKEVKLTLISVSGLSEKLVEKIYNCLGYFYVFKGI